MSPMHLRLAAVGLASVCYIALTHWLMTAAPTSGWSVVVILTPVLTAVTIGAWRSGQRVIGALAGLCYLGLCVAAALGVSVAPRLLYLAENVGINLFLAGVFGFSLRPGHTALITQMAARVHRIFTADMAAYTRRCTLGWTIYFIVMATISIGLFVFAPFEAWATFANIITPIAVVAMFGGEYLMRYRWHPEFERTTLADSVRSYMESDPRPSPTSRDPVV